VADYEEYLRRRPDDDEATLALAEALSARREPEALQRALALYDAFLARHPADDAVILRRARVRAWAGDARGAAAELRAWVARHPQDASVRLELADALMSLRDPHALAESARLYNRHLLARPGDDVVRLRRARVRGQLRQNALAAADYRAYLARHPEDDAVRLELAQALSWAKEKTLLLESIAVYDEILRRAPARAEIRLARARVRTWAARFADAVEDFRAYLHKRKDAKVRVELAQALAQAGRLKEAAAEYAAARGEGMNGPEVRLAHARVLVWSGAHTEAERELLALRKDAVEPLRHEVELELARLYAQTERPLSAVEVLDGMLARNPNDAAAKTERARVGQVYEPVVTPGFFVYADKYNALLTATTVEAKVFFTPRYNLVVDAEIWRLSDGQGALWTSRLDAGLQARLLEELELELALGPRFYEDGTPKLGAHLALRSRPTSWLSLGARYAYDDIYQELYQAGSARAGVHGSALHADVEIRFPYEVTLQARVGGRQVQPDNSDTEGNATLSVPVNKLVRVGYFGQWLSWRQPTTSYWSPQNYAAHLLFARVADRVSDTLSYEVQGSLGTATERVDGVPSPGYGAAFGGAGGLLWIPRPAIRARFGLQFGTTVREQISELSAVGGQPLRVSNSSSYWWLTTTASVGVIF
jgi:Flp pilus assembly protein TadD